MTYLRHTDNTSMDSRILDLRITVNYPSLKALASDANIKKMFWTTEYTSAMTLLPWLAQIHLNSPRQAPRMPKLLKFWLRHPVTIPNSLFLYVLYLFCRLMFMPLMQQTLHNQYTEILQVVNHLPWDVLIVDSLFYTYAATLYRLMPAETKLIQFNTAVVNSESAWHKQFNWPISTQPPVYLTNQRPRWHVCFGFVFVFIFSLRLSFEECLTTRRELAYFD